MQATRPDSSPRRLRWSVTAFAMLAAILALSAHAAELVTGKAEALDGGSLKVAGRTIDLLGVTAPTLDQTCLEWRGRGQTRYPCGRHAAALLASLVSDRTVFCVMDVRPGRPSHEGSCYADGRDIAEAMVSAGWAVANPQRTNRYVPTQDSARLSKRGLWAGNFDLPPR